MKVLASHSTNSQGTQHDLFQPGRSRNECQELLSEQRQLGQERVHCVPAGQKQVMVKGEMCRCGYQPFKLPGSIIIGPANRILV
jgi:hypothetical protein